MAVLGLSALAQGKQAHAAALKISSKPWGTVGGKSVKLYTLSNGSMKVNITNFGGIVQSIDVPGKHGKRANVALGFKNLKGYEANDATTQPAGGSGTTYFGATIGRFGNRIANGKFTLNGTTYHLPVNNGPNTLHGGTDAWNKQVWAPKTSLTPAGASLALTYTSPNGQDGFPGTVVAKVTFTLGAKNALTIHYDATTDKPTVINMTNHTYFNLGGEASGTIYNQGLMINADKYTPTDDTQIPTGKIAPVAGTPMDFRKLKPIGRDINANFHQLLLAHGYDHNWVLNGPSGGAPRLAAKAVDPASGRVLTATTTEPGVQVYTGNFLVGDLVGTSGHAYRQGDGFTLETQHFPNSPNQPNFPTTTLNPGTPYNSTTVFAFSVQK
ncbi:MAG TPA: aldose epimerase family protein [Solirubrobacteraceae bacterium]|nr:aldose epimerase family protein [Solirubrobacteraceae bacterium]